MQILSTGWDAMFIRKKTFTNKDGTTREYLQLVESYRVNGRSRQRVIANLGRLEDLQGGQLDRLIENLTRFSETQWVRMSLDETQASWSKQWGPALIFHNLWEEKLGLGPCVRRILNRTEKTSPFEEALFAMVLNRLCDPLSKLGLNERWLQSVYHPPLEKLQFHHFYHALDFVAEYKNEIESFLFDRVRNLFNCELDLVFWDTTSTYFEGSGPEELAKYDYSKDKRPDRLQIMIGLLMTKEGIPVSHHIFPGNTGDVRTFKAAFSDLRRRFNVTRVIMVGDRGMVSKKVLQEISAAGLQYIVGVKMRRRPDIDRMLSWNAPYTRVKENLKVKEVWSNGISRYILCFNPEGAERDRNARREMIIKLKRKLDSGNIKGLLGNKGYRQYLKASKNAVTIDHDAIRREARYDGKYMLKTNTDLPPDQVVLAYKELWRVERVFRELKPGLELRPIYHWTESRVRGHVMVCFLALVLESALIRYLKGKQSKAGYLQVMADLATLHAIQFSFNDKVYLFRTELQGDAYEAFRVLGLRPPLKAQILTQLPHTGNM